MSNVLLVCSGGMSSAIVLKDLEKEFQKLGEPLRAKAVGSGQAQDEISAGEWDLVLVAPQVRNRLKTFQQYADRHGIPDLRDSSDCLRSAWRFRTGKDCQRTSRVIAMEKFFNFLDRRVPGSDVDDIGAATYPGYSRRCNFRYPLHHRWQLNSYYSSSAGP